MGKSKTKWLIVLAVLAVLVVAAELVLRLVTPFVPVQWMQLSENPKLIWEQKPNMVVPFRGHVTVIDGCPCEFRTNSRGFRDIEHEPVKPAGVFRIVGLGCTDMAGLGVAWEQTKLERLKRLIASPDGPPLETINLGVGGYHFEQHLENLRVNGLSYEPDLVIIDMDHDRLKPPIHIEKILRFGQLPARSALARLLINGLQRPLVYPADRRADPQEVMARLESLRQLAHKHGFDVAFTVAVVEGLVWPEFIDRARSFGMAVVIYDFGALPEKQYLLAGDTGHLSAGGNALWAEVTACHLARKKLLSQAMTDSVAARLDCEKLERYRRETVGVAPGFHNAPTAPPR